MMVIYSPLLAGISLAALLLSVLLRIAYFQSAKLANANVLSTQAIENTSFIESIRGIKVIKLFCQEENRQRIWQFKREASAAALLSSNRLASNFDVAANTATGAELLAFVYVVGGLVSTGEMTLGMAFAFQSHRQHFMGSALRLVEQVMSYRLMDVHLERLADIVRAQPEDPRQSRRVVTDADRFSTLRLKEICFRYGKDEPLVLAGASLEIPKGNTVAIVGASGAGKSTFLKLLCCLVPSESGEYLVDGLRLSDYGVRRLRDQLGVVSQEDTLFAGSISENITFFDADADYAWMVDCCKVSAIHEEILHMPMGYETPVGDMGSNLSGGQKQRVLLARALYKRPTMLVLDEGTAHLDLVTEATVAANIRQLGISRVIVAHRPETIRSADVIMALIHGRLTDVTADVKAGMEASGPRKSSAG
jgi:ATP-binding cassette subfamily B protein RaxB